MYTCYEQYIFGVLAHWYLPLVEGIPRGVRLIYTTGGYRPNITKLKTICLTLSNGVYHFNLHPLQAANCCRNSRLVVNEDDMTCMGDK